MNKLMNNEISVKVPLSEIIDEDRPVIDQITACYLTLSVANTALNALGITLEPDYSEDHPFNVMDRRKYGVQEQV